MKKVGIIFLTILIILCGGIFAYRTHMSNKIRDVISNTFIGNTISADITGPQIFLEIPVSNETGDNFKFKLDIFDNNGKKLNYIFMGEPKDGDIDGIFTLFFKDSILGLKEYKFPANAIQRLGDNTFQVDFKNFGGYTNEDGDTFYTLFPRGKVDSVYLQIFNGNDYHLEFSILDDINAINQGNFDTTDIDSIIEKAILAHEDCGKDWSENENTFISYAILGTGINKTGNLEYYLVTNGEGFYIDERGNLSSACGFAGIPTTIEFSDNGSGYEVVRYQQAMDGNLYVSSTKEMFSKEAFKKWEKGNFVYNTDIPFLEQAEKYFGITVIPETENKFECDFCDKVRYESDSDDDYFKDKNISIGYKLSLEPTENKTFEFKSNGEFETKGSWDQGTGTWVFGKDENTVIVLMNELQHVYNRYDILQKNETGVLMSLEIIQRR